MLEEDVGAQRLKPDTWLERASLVAQTGKNLPVMCETWV